jgi:hypothetical protein
MFTAGRAESAQVGNTILRADMEAGTLENKALQCTRAAGAQAAAPAEWHQFGLAFEEAHRIRDKIVELRAQGTPYGEMAVLSRINRCQALQGGKYGVLAHVKRALTEAGIPNKAFRGSTCARAPRCYTVALSAAANVQRRCRGDLLGSVYHTFPQRSVA